VKVRAIQSGYASLDRAHCILFGTRSSVAYLPFWQTATPSAKSIEPKAHLSDRSCGTYKTSSSRTIPHPNSIASHHVRHHDIGGKSISNNSDLIWSCHASIRMRLEVGHDLCFTSWLLGGMSQDLDAGVGLQYCSFLLLLV
jgi:hypothetical protein